MDKVISVIVPVYNVKPYLDECVQSLVDQTYQNIEIILADDGSTDGSAELCDAWDAKDQRVKVLHLDHVGVSVARNRGIEIAKGEYLYFVDSDDYIDKTLCARVMEKFSAHNADVVAFGYLRVTESGKPLKEMPGVDMQWDREGALMALSLGQLRNAACCKAYKKSLWDEIRFPAGRLYEDVATTYKVLLQSNVVCGISDMLYYYRKREGSTVTTMTSRSLRDLFLMQKQMHDDLLPIYPKMAANIFSDLARSAKAYADHAIYDKSEHEVLGQVTAFLQENKEKILAWGGTEFKLYYRFPKLYPIYRRLRYLLDRDR